MQPSSSLPNRRITTVLAALIVSISGCGDSGSSSNGGGGSGANNTGAGEPGGGGSGATGGNNTGGGGNPTTGGGGEGAGGGSSSYGDVQCQNTLTAPPSGVCGVATAGSSGVLLRGTVLGADAIYRDGGVLVDDAGIIQCVGCDCDAGQAAVIDCPEGVISPGLINPHDHITFANNAPADWGTTRYAHRHEWRTGANGMPEINVNSGASAAVVSFAELRFIMSGATSAASAGGRAGLLRNLDGNNQEGLPAQQADSDTFPLNDQSGTLRTDDCDYGNNPTTEQDIDGLRGYLPHISEGIGDAAQNEFVCTSSMSVQDAHDLVEPQTAIVHAVAVTADDIALMRADQTSVIWSPRSNISLYGDTARVSLIDALGVQISLGTDWMPSGSMNILRELRCADEFNANYLNGYFSDLELWRMVTENAAFATGTQDAIGMLKVGYVADIAVFDARVRTDFRAVVGAGVEDVTLVLRGGEVLYGDTDLLDEPEIGGSACETLDVCGVAKKACVAQDLGGSNTLASIRAAGEAFYPLFYCNDETPADEPSCVPFRNSYPDGITATDADGDGVADSEDLCPDVFDPIRPMDNGAQADADGDGIGDACDPCPLDMGSCAAPSADDIDGDGFINGDDVCPELADDQADADGDGKGDGCDACPDVANPGASACPVSVVSIATVRNPAAPGHPAMGATVAVTGYVTAVRPDMGSSRGFVIQDGTDPWSGIFIFTGSNSPGVVRGNQVQVTGTYEEFFDYSELTSPTTTILDAGTTLPFMPISVPATGTLSTPATAEPFESMLVTIGACSITAQNADAMDFDEFGVTSMGSQQLRINDGMFTALDNLCTVGSTFTSITGTLAYSFSNFKLEPRDAADIVGASCQPYP
jgi:cytosine/adenosine deaminase-related metal-dependent hydrolase